MTNKPRPKGLKPLISLVADVLLQLDLSHMFNEKAETVGQFLIRGYRELNMFHRSHTEVKYLPVSDMNTVDLPEDYIDYNKIGLVYGGRVWTLTINESIALPRKETCGLPVRKDKGVTGNVPDWGYRFPDHYQNGRFVGGLYGLGGGFNQAYYRIDKARHQIVLSGQIPKCEIVLEYQSNGVSSSTETLVPVECTEALIAFAVWKMSMTDEKKAMNLKFYYEQLYQQEVEKLRFYESAMTFDEWRDALYATFYSAPKR